MFAHLPPYAGDPILSLMNTFNRDNRSNKINLSIGIYFDQEGKLSFPPTVAQAASEIPNQAYSYLPMEGHAGFRQAVHSLLFDTTITEEYSAVIQTLGGSGALKLSADFLKQYFPQSRTHISNPTWDNHRSIFEGAGFEVANYPYYDPKTSGVNFDALCNYLHALPPQDIVLLHPCCHNPTGADLSPEQWDKVLDIISTNQLIPLMDMAYQGFGGTFEEDAYPLRQAAQLKLPLLAICSFSKNMSLYAERIGALAVLCPDPQQAQTVLGQLQAGVRRIYSSPPVRGALIAHNVLSDPNRRQQWQQEVYAMRDRIQSMRRALFDALSTQLPNHDFAYFIKQRGMFSYTGLSPQQVQRLQDEFAVYLVSSGRMCVAGLNQHNINRTADALATIFRQG